MKKALYAIKLKQKDKLILEKNKERFIKQFIHTLFFSIIFLLIPLHSKNYSITQLPSFVQEGINTPPFWIFGIIELILLFGAFHSLSFAIISQKLTFDKINDTLEIDSDIWTKIGDSQHLKITENEDSDGDKTYNLYIISHTHRKIFIDSESDKNEVLEMAEEIANFLNLGIKIEKVI